MFNQNYQNYQNQQANQFNQTNQIQQFHSEEFGSIGVLLIGSKPYFPATECAKVLGYKNPRDAISRHCKVDGVVKHDGVSFTTNQHGFSTQQTVERTYINEGNLYRLIIRSKLPSAERFESFVFDTVLPNIRKFGAFIEQGTLEEMVANPEFTAALLEQLQKERKINAELAPKASYYDRILQCKNAVPVSLIAKDYGMSAAAFNRLLHDFGIQYKISGTWLLYQEYAGKGYTQTKTYHYGESAAAMHTCWTQRGRLFLYDFLLNEGIEPLAALLDAAQGFIQDSTEDYIEDYIEGEYKEIMDDECAGASA